MENSKEQQRFSEIISKHLNGKRLSDDEKKELSTIAKKNNFNVERKETNLDGKLNFTDCYWICRGSNWSCNPQQPPPGCECYQVCI